MAVQSRLRLLERIGEQQSALVPTFVPHYDLASRDLRAWLWLVPLCCRSL
jgi:hypothetical protein